jgi:hypothetical protein
MADDARNQEILMNKAKLNYWVDVGIGMAGAISAITGLVLLLPADSSAGILGISLRLWSSAHTWSSLAAVGGVGLHLALHWKWAMAMTRQVLATTDRREITVATSAPESAPAGGTPMSRRAVLALGGLAAVATGLAVAGYKVIAEAGSFGADDGASAVPGERQASSVACPRGLVNDPYPGQCRHYVDSNGDGICDYSIAGSGSQISGNAVGGSWGALPERRGNWGRP